MSGFDAAAALLPGELRRGVEALPAELRSEAQEFRLRLGRRPTVVIGAREEPVPGAEAVTKQDLSRVLELATGASPYAAEEGMRQGYVTGQSGVRVGLCGRMRPGAEGGWALSGLTSAAVRIPRQVVGCGEAFCVLPFPSTLILSPPGAGKTTLLRDMVRALSERGLRVALCDERGEVAALSENGPGFDVGPRTDVLGDLPKSRAATQLLRTMNPQLLAMDEICTAEDAAACRAAAGGGVALLATAHGGESEELSGRHLLSGLAADRVIRRIIRIGVERGRRTYRETWLP